VAYIKGGRRSWMAERVQRCENGTAAEKKDCSYPLLWTFSPHVLHLAPEWATWYSKQVLRTKVDGFALPPSGDLYSYPSLFPEDDQDTFVKNTERVAGLLSTSVSSVWEWAGRWGSALDKYFPKFGERGVVTSLVATNVPYNIPTLAFGDGFYKVKGKAVVFKPHEWRGTRGSTIPFADKENLTVEQMATQLNSYKPGTIVPIYITSDGGANLNDVYELVAKLASHVEIVGTQTGDLALAAEAAKAQ